MAVVPVRTRSRVVGWGAVGLLAIDVAVLPFVPGAVAIWLRLAVLVLVVACLVVVVRQAWGRPGMLVAPATRAKSAMYAFGGPCDGQRLRLPRRVPLPEQLWLKPQGQPGEQPSRYVQVPSADGPPSYRYERVLPG